MSTDYYLVSPSRKRAAQIGSVGLSGTQTCAGSAPVLRFVRWAINQSVTDVVMVDENRLTLLEEADTPPNQELISWPEVTEEESRA